jgi:hypothetical protein
VKPIRTVNPLMTRQLRAIRARAMSCLAKMIIQRGTGREKSFFQVSWRYSIFPNRAVCKVTNRGSIKRLQNTITD